MVNFLKLVKSVSNFPEVKFMMNFPQLKFILSFLEQIKV